MLGHASAVMTLDRYGHLMPGQAEAVADRLDVLAAAAGRTPSAQVVGLDSVAGWTRDGTERAGSRKAEKMAPTWGFVVVETGVDPVTFRFSGGRSAD